MAGQTEECLSSSYVAENLLSGSISFGRFDVESLSWERRSSFLHNRYLEEVEKYSTPGSVTKKKEYFEAHFKKKALLQQVSEENQKEKESRHAESITGDNDGMVEGFICHGCNELAEVDDGDALAVSDEHEIAEIRKKEMLSAELSTKFGSLDSENGHEPLNFNGIIKNQVGHDGAQLDEGNFCRIVEDETVNEDANCKELAENGDASSKIIKTKEEPIQMKTEKSLMKTSEHAEYKAGKLQIKTNLPTQMLKKPSRIGNSVSTGRLKNLGKQNALARPEKRRVSKGSFPASAENGNYKVAFRNINAKTSPEVRSEGAARAEKSEVMSRPIENRGNNVRRTANRVKLVSKAEDKQIYAVFNFKSSERAEKRKEYNLKLEERLHAKEAELNEIQARTEEEKEAEMKQFRRSLNFKAAPMPSFYHEAASKTSQRKKTSTIPIKSSITRKNCSTQHEEALPSHTSNNEKCVIIESHVSTQPISPLLSNTVDGCSTTTSGNNKEKDVETLKNFSKNSILLKGEEGKKKGKSESRMRGRVVGKVKDSVVVNSSS